MWGQPQPYGYYPPAPGAAPAPYAPGKLHNALAAMSRRLVSHAGSAEGPSSCMQALMEPLKRVQRHTHTRLLRLALLPMAISHQQHQHQQAHTQ